MPFIPAVLTLSLVSLSAPTLAVAAQGDVSSAEPVIAKLRNTHYYVVLESDYAADPLDATIRDLQDRVLAQISLRFKRALNIEGSGRLRDGRVVNYAGIRDQEIRYRFTPNPFGDGVGTCALVPFHTIAVDPSVIPMGSVVRIDETVGMILPDGSTHDGLWRAEDVGGAIKKDRVDLFVGDGPEGGRTLVKHGIRHLQALTVRLVQEPASENCTTRSPSATETTADESFTAFRASGELR